MPFWLAWELWSLFAALETAASFRFFADGEGVTFLLALVESPSTLFWGGLVVAAILSEAFGAPVQDGWRRNSAAKM